MIYPKFFGHTEKGSSEIRFELPDKYRMYVSDLFGRVEVIVKKYRKQRSNDQNEYYWGVIVDILADHWGYTKDEAHEAIKLKFLVVKRPGKPDTIGSTRKMNTVQAENFYANIRMWAAQDYSIIIPLPNETEAEIEGVENQT